MKGLDLAITILSLTGQKPTNGRIEFGENMVILTGRKLQDYYALIIVTILLFSVE